MNSNTDTIINALSDQDLAIGIVEGQKKKSAILYQPFLTDKVVVVCSAKSPFTKKKRIPLTAAAQYVAICRNAPGNKGT